MNVEKCTTPSRFPRLATYHLELLLSAVLYNPMDGLSAHTSGLTHLHVPEEQHYTKVTCEPTSEEGGRVS